MSGDDESPGGSSDAAGGSSNLMVGPNYRSQVHLPDRRLRTSSVWFFLDPPIHIAHLAKSRLVSVRRFELINLASVPEKMRIIQKTFVPRRRIH